MKTKTLPVRFDQSRLAYEAKCPDCGITVFYLTQEFITRSPEQIKVPFVATHGCEKE